MPVGNAGNITAYWRGYREYHADGLIDRPAGDARLPGRRGGADRARPPGREARDDRDRHPHRQPGVVGAGRRGRARSPAARSGPSPTARSSAYRLIARHGVFARWPRPPRWPGLLQLHAAGELDARADGRVRPDRARASRTRTGRSRPVRRAGRRQPGVATIPDVGPTCPAPGRPSLRWLPRPTPTPSSPSRATTGSCPTSSGGTCRGPSPVLSTAVRTPPRPVARDVRARDYDEAVRPLRRFVTFVASSPVGSDPKFSVVVPRECPDSRWGEVLEGVVSNAHPAETCGPLPRSIDGLAACRITQGAWST
jgi:hypothetical protein